MPPIARTDLVLAACAVATIAGCASPQAYPSLEPRPIEGVSLAEPLPRAVAAPTPAQSADMRYAAIVERALRGDTEFRARLDSARATLARGREAAWGSDDWGAAQQSLSRLETARAPVVAALTTLEAASQAADTRADRGLADAAGRALDRVRAIDAEEAATLARAAPVRRGP